MSLDDSMSSRGKAGDGLGVAFAVCAAATLGVLWRIRRRRPERPVLEQLAETLTMGDRKSWRMPPRPFSSPFDGRPALGWACWRCADTSLSEQLCCSQGDSTQQRLSSLAP
jgi:hypothetical protein